MIIGVPLFAVIYYVLRNVLNYIIKKKNLPLESEKYILAERLNEENRELVEYEQQELLHQASQEKKKSRFQEWRKKFDKKQQKK